VIQETIDYILIVIWIVIRGFKRIPYFTVSVVSREKAQFSTDV